MSDAKAALIASLFTSAEPDKVVTAVSVYPFTDALTAFTSTSVA